MKAWIVFVTLCAAFGLHAYASIKAYTPSSLREYYSGIRVGLEIRHSYANFGRIPYGTLLAGRVYYFADNSSFCKKDGQIILDREGDPDNDFTPIVLVERGGCSFIRKTKNVQEIGGAMTLIMNHNNEQNPEDIIMVDDGTGLNVAIPTVMISKADGERLKEAVLETEKNNKNPANRKEYVVLLVEFEMNKPDDRVEYDIWYTSGDIKALDFMRRMKHYSDKLGSNALMTPHMMVRVCRHCDNNDPSCRRYGDIMYCAPPIKNSVISGADSLRLGLDELCIYDAYKDTDNAAKWWDYMDHIYDCKSSNFNEECVAKARDKADIDVSRIQACRYRDAEILKREYSSWVASGIPYNPAIVINNHVYRGSLDPENVFRSICAGFNITPAVCNQDYNMEEAKGGISGKTVFWIIILVIAINVVLVYCYRRYSKREMKEEMQLQISSMMSQYFALSEGGSKNTQPYVKP